MAQSDWLGIVYQEYRRELFLAAWSVLRRADLAEDAVHAAFASLVRLNSVPAEPKLYVFRSVRNAAIDLAKARSRRREQPLPSDWDAACDEPRAADEELSRVVAALLEDLDAPSREVVELRLHARLTFQEIARVLDEPPATVASRYRRACEKLAKEMKVRHE